MDVLTDERFAHVATDVRFKGIPRQERRIKIDKRFQSMFTDNKFKSKSTVMDKRGRPPQSFISSANENLKKYYDISSDSASFSSSSEENDDGDDNEGELQERPSTPTPRSGRKLVKSSIPAIKGICDDGSDSSDDEDNDEDHEKEEIVDYARGRGNIETSSSSEDDDDDDDANDDDDVEMVHPWGEMDENADRTNDSPTKRLAVCNMDWDKVKAQDIHVLLSSFMPAGGVILNIKIYLSDFGRERLSKEDIDGPEELIATNGGPSKTMDSDDKDMDRERVRRYQLSRLRYYYAIVECDNEQTASALYDECDGLEYESSATRLDLRFVPDDMDFDEEPKSVMNTSVDVGRYRPQLFTTAALQQSNVKLTWDETSADRLQTFQRAFKQNPNQNRNRNNNNDKDDGDVEQYDDLRAYLASSSSSSSDDEDRNEQQQSDDNSDTSHQQGTEEDRISKYKALLSGIGDADPDEMIADDGDVHMEITWGSGLKEQAESIVQRKLLEKENKGESNLSSWERYLEKRKEKRKRHIKEKLKAGAKNSSHSKNDNNTASEDDQLSIDDSSQIDVDESQVVKKQSSSDKKRIGKSKKSYKNKMITNDDQIDERQKANLELLMMDEEDHKNHFSLKKLLKSDKSAKKTKNAKQKQTNDDAAVDNDFQINVNDPRFAAVYTSHLFNIDPSEPHFKKTGGMAAMVDEKQRRVTSATASSTTPPMKAKRARPNPEVSNKKTISTTATPMGSNSDGNRNELSLLVKSVKSKATCFMTKKQNRTTMKR